MRFLFAREVELLLNTAGFELISLRPTTGEDWASTAEDWNVTWTARAR